MTEERKAYAAFATANANVADAVKKQVEIEMDVSKLLVVELCEIAERLVKALLPVTRGMVATDTAIKEGKTLVPLANAMHINNEKLRGVYNQIENTLEGLEL